VCVRVCGRVCGRVRRLLHCCHHSACTPCPATKGVQPPNRSAHARRSHRGNTSTAAAMRQQHPPTWHCGAAQGVGGTSCVCVAAGPPAAAARAVRHTRRGCPAWASKLTRTAAGAWPALRQPQQQPAAAPCTAGASSWLCSCAPALLTASPARCGQAAVLQPAASAAPAAPPAALCSLRRCSYDEVSSVLRALRHKDWATQNSCCSRDKTLHRRPRQPRCVDSRLLTAPCAMACSDCGFARESLSPFQTALRV
jgi:hypothetical protein